MSTFTVNSENEKLKTISLFQEKVLDAFDDMIYRRDLDGAIFHRFVEVEFRRSLVMTEKTLPNFFGFSKKVVKERKMINTSKFELTIFEDNFGLIITFNRKNNSIRIKIHNRNISKIWETNYSEFYWGLEDFKNQVFDYFYNNHLEFFERPKI